jgi:LytS/YehU family sensor histidine kinase
MVLQLLIENAIKHNIVSKSKPLTIDISIVDNAYLQVRNNLQLKTSTEITSQIGLKNIQKRYEYLSTKKIIIEQTDTFFTVKIPLVCEEENI